MKSRMGRPKTHIAGDNFVSLYGVFLYCKMARWNESVARLSSGFFIINDEALDCLHPTSARQLLYGKATDDKRWCTPSHSRTS